MKQAPLLLGLLASACQTDAPPDPGAEARKIEAAFAETCGTGSVDIQAIHARTSALSYGPMTSESVVFYQLRPPHDGLVVSVQDNPAECDVAPANPVLPEAIVAKLAEHLAATGSMAVEPPAPSPSRTDCRSYRFGDAVRSACIIDFTPHGVAPALVLSKPVANTPAS